MAIGQKDETKSKQKGMNFIMKINLNKNLFNLYSFLFIYTMINREFLLLGMDLRYVVLILGIFLVLISFITRNKLDLKIEITKNNSIDRIYKLLILLFIWSLFSNISWIWNGLEKFPKEIINQNILIFNNLLSIIVFKKFKKYIDEEKIKKMVIFSCAILVVSFILTGMGYSLSQISGSNVRSMVKASVGATEHKNIFGGNFRIAGYAEDPNYASIFLVLGAITALQLNCKKKLRYMFFLIFLIAFGFSCSKTILISFILGMLYLFCIRTFKKRCFSKFVNIVFTIGIAILVIILPISGLLSTHTTMTTRFKMWNMAKVLFLNSPLIGNGINSFKSYINAQYNGLWYVQPHSTYWQLLSETGMIGFIIFIKLMINCLNNSELSKYNKYLLFIFFIFIINFETIQLQIFVYIILVLNLFSEKKLEV